MSRQPDILRSLSTFEGLLLAKGVLNEQRLEAAKKEALAQGIHLQDLLIQRKVMDIADLERLLHGHYGNQHVPAAAIRPDFKLLELLPEDFLYRNHIFPLSLMSELRRIEILMVDPDQTQVLDEIALLTGLRAVPKVTHALEIKKLLEKLPNKSALSTDEALNQAAKVLSNDGDNDMLQDLEDEIAAEDAPVVQLVNAILAEAIKKNASDVHLESQKDNLLVRFRIDGTLRDAKTIPKNLAGALISRIKVVSGMDIAERRRPQDGRMSLNSGNTTMDLRVNTLAVQHGESVVMRILKSNTTAVGLEKLGLAPEEAETLNRIAHMPNGIILVTGPTGSGKTTTLYACLREVNSRERKIVTIEDPIEYPLPGINQTQISHKAGLDFSVSLRAIMRQDPDIIMVGEIRDKETLDAAMHAAMTGHLVLSTIHTNSTAKTITRLREMGADSAMISSTLVGIIAQRLVRRICGHCKTPYKASAEELKTLGFENSTHPITLYKGTGCHHCEHSGYYGRIGLYEIMECNRDIQKLIDEGASILQIEDAAVSNGMIRLGMNGERKVAAGMTTVEEVSRVLGPNW